MSNHTPGPWKIADKEALGSKSLRTTVKNARGEDVVIIENWTKPEDARLIAAAPELLETLERLLDCSPDDGMLMSDAIDEARAAIRQAKGGA